MNRKIISGALVAVLSLTTLAGCGTTAETEDIFSQQIGGEITVSAFEATTYTSYLEEAARRFEEKHPGTKVNIDIAGSMPQVRTQEADGMRIGVVQADNDQQAREDYIRRISTELMSGRGADILALDILPYYKYADSGLLVDLDDFMRSDNDFNRGDFAENIFDGVKYKGGQFLFPTAYTFSYFSYNRSLAPDFPTKDKLSFADMFNAVSGSARDTDNKIFPLAAHTVIGGNLFSELFTQNYEKFIDVEGKNANFTGGEFAELLETVKSYADEGFIPAASTADPRTGAAGGQAGGSGVQMNMSAFMQNNQEQFYARTNRNLVLVNQFTRDLGEQTLRVMMVAGGGDTSNDEIAGLVANDNDEVQFSYNMGFGMNQNSENKRTAWEFLKFLAGEEMQTSGFARPDGIPVNKNARERLAAMSITGENISRQAGRIITGMSDTSDIAGEAVSGELTPEQKTALANYLSQLEKFTALLNKHIIRDERIDSMIQDEVRHFFAGTRSAEEVANALQSRINLYLNE